MTDKQLVKTVTSFRKGILGKRSDLTMCYMVCLPISTFLSGCGVDNRLTEGKVKLNGHNKGLAIGHFWITLKDGRIIDPTISQFNGMGNEDMPIVYLGDKPEWVVEKKIPSKRASK